MFEWQRKAQDILNKALVLVTLNVFENEFFVMRRSRGAQKDVGWRFGFIHLSAQYWRRTTT